MLSPDDPWWADWFRLAGVEAPDLAAQAGLRLDNQQMDGAAALAGQGVAVLTPELWAAELRAGRLVQPFDLVAETDSSYWLVYPQERRHVPKIRAFREWLLGEVDRFHAEERQAPVSAGPAPESRSWRPR